MTEAFWITKRGKVALADLTCDEWDEAYAEVSRALEGLRTPSIIAWFERLRVALLAVAPKVEA